jgi:hypothetical protein
MLTYREKEWLGIIAAPSFTYSHIGVRYSTKLASNEHSLGARASLEISTIKCNLKLIQKKEPGL